MKLTDAFLNFPEPPTPAEQAALREQFDDAQIMELLLGVGLYHGMSKVLIVLGLEPDSMPVTQLPTPGSDVAA